MLRKFFLTLLFVALVPMSLMASSDPTDDEPVSSSRPTVRIVPPSLKEQADFFDGRKTLEELNKSRVERGDPPLNDGDLERVRNGFYQLRELGQWFVNGFTGFMKGMAK